MNKFIEKLFYVFVFMCLGLIIYWLSTANTQCKKDGGYYVRTWDGMECIKK